MAECRKVWEHLHSHLLQQNGTRHDEFKVVWRDAERKRRFKTFGDFDDAWKFAGNVNAAINSGDIQATVLKNADRHTYLDALEALKDLPVPLNIAVRQYADSVKRLGAVSLNDAVNFYLKHNAEVESRTVKEVFTEFVGAKRSPASKAKKKASEKHLADIESRLGKFQMRSNARLPTFAQSRSRSF
ncbi:MAG: hypothetical protein ACXW3Z_09185 [Limisphaerales bacterium]